MSSKASAQPEETPQARSLVYAKDLVRQLEAGNYNEADRIIGELSNIRDNELYQEVGKLTRKLHEKINEFVQDTRMQTIMQDEMPGAKERLDYVIKLTEQSAHDTIASVENSMPIIDELGTRAQELGKQWQELVKAPKDETVNEFFQKIVEETKMVHDDLSDILIAQSYQDITGQIIQRVINMVHEVEQRLIEIIKMSNKDIKPHSQNDMKKNNKGYGPAVPCEQNRNVLNCQDDVDDLLSTLGF